MRRPVSLNKRVIVRRYRSHVAKTDQAVLWQCTIDNNGQRRESHSHKPALLQRFRINNDSECRQIKKPMVESLLPQVSAFPASPPRTLLAPRPNTPYAVRTKSGGVRRRAGPNA